MLSCIESGANKVSYYALIISIIIIIFWKPSQSFDPYKFLSKF